jgi:hypothetical protein
MRILLGTALGLLAGCAVQPAAGGEERPGDAIDGAQATNAIAIRLQQLQHSHLLCLGVEFLPPAASEEPLATPTPPVHVEPVPLPPRPAPRPPEYQPYGDRDRYEPHTWLMSGEDLANVRDPLERETLHFIDDLMGEDRRRLRRDIGTPILTMQAADLQSPGLDRGTTDPQADEESQWMAQHGVELLRRPFNRMLRRTPIVQQIEVDLDDWKESNVPLSEEYSRTHDTHDLGRMSMRVHANDYKDPVELVYMRSGVRVGSSQTQLKLGLSRHLSRDLLLELRAREDYDDSEWHLRADLSWLVSPRTSLHFVAGDNLDFMATSTVYSLFESPMDGSPGLLVYAVHLF